MWALTTRSVSQIRLRFSDRASVLAQFKGLRFAPPALRAAPPAPLSWAARADVSGAATSAERRGEKMLRIYSVALDWIERIEPRIARIARGDRELAAQLRRASASVVLNLAEGMGARGGHRTNAYGVSLREMRESYAALQVAQRRRLIGALDDGSRRSVSG
jgi:four helix bundle protein